MREIGSVRALVTMTIGSTLGYRLSGQTRGACRYWDLIPPAGPSPRLLLLAGSSEFSTSGSLGGGRGRYTLQTGFA